MSQVRISAPRSITVTGTTIENEPIIKSDGASSDVMQWLSNDESSNITISEDASNNLDLVVSAGNVGVGVTPRTDWRSELSGVLQFGDTGALTGGTTAWGGWVTLSTNSYRDSSGYKRLIPGYAAMHEMSDRDGEHTFKVSGTSAAADAAITWTDAVKITNTGGIYETNGVLKENLLTNSGFDVWSNSTLEDATGTNLVSSWDDASYPYETFTPNGANIDQAVNSTGYGIAVATIASPVVGKLYKISFSIALASGTMPRVFTAASEGYTNGSVGGVTPTAGSNEIVFEATANDVVIEFWTSSGDATDFAVSSFTLTEVTPGCVVADNKAFDGWQKQANSAHGDIWRQHNDATLTHDGSFYSLKMTSHATSTLQVLQPFHPWTDAINLQKYAGRTVTMGAWVYVSDSSTPSVFINDTADPWTSLDSSDSHSGATGWEWLEVTRTIGASPAKFVIGFNQIANKTCYISQPMLVFGSAIGAGNYSRPSGEVVWCEKVVPMNTSLSASSDVSAVSLNLEAETNGMLPKGASAVYARTYSRDSGSAGSTDSCRLKLYADATATTGLENSVNGLANDAYNYLTGTVPCDENGDLKYSIDASGSGTSDNNISFYGVQLR
jgi:hypothetical protein